VREEGSSRFLCSYQSIFERLIKGEEQAAPPFDIDEGLDFLFSFLDENKKEHLFRGDVYLPKLLAVLFYNRF